MPPDITAEALVHQQGRSQPLAAPDLLPTDPRRLREQPAPSRAQAPPQLPAPDPPQQQQQQQQQQQLVLPDALLQSLQQMLPQPQQQAGAAELPSDPRQRRQQPASSQPQTQPHLQQHLLPTELLQSLQQLVPLQQQQQAASAAECTDPRQPRQQPALSLTQEQPKLPHALLQSLQQVVPPPQQQAAAAELPSQPQRLSAEQMVQLMSAINATRASSAASSQPPAQQLQLPLQSLPVTASQPPKQPPAQQLALQPPPFPQQLPPTRKRRSRFEDSDGAPVISQPAPSSTGLQQHQQLQQIASELPPQGRVTPPLGMAAGFAPQSGLLSKGAPQPSLARGLLQRAALPDAKPLAGDGFLDQLSDWEPPAARPLEQQTDWEPPSPSSIERRSQQPAASISPGRVVTPPRVRTTTPSAPDAEEQAVLHALAHKVRGTSRVSNSEHHLD